MARGELTGSRICAVVFPGESALDERGWMAVGHGDRLPDTGQTDGTDVFVLEVLEEDVLWAEERGRGNGKDDVLFPIGELFKDRLAW